MADFFIIAGLVLLIFCVGLLILATIRPKSFLWIALFITEVLSFVGIIFFVTSISDLQDAGILDVGDAIGSAILSAIGLVAFAVLLGLSLVVGLIVLLVTKHKKKKQQQNENYYA